MAHRWQRDIPCQDALGRRRTLQVYVTDEDQIGITTPPGETAFIGEDDLAGAVRDALAEAQVVQRSHQ